MTDIEKLEQITSEELGQLLVELLRRIKFENIDIHGNVIIATKNDGISDTIYSFILAPIRLSGTTSGSIESIQSIVAEAHTKSESEKIVLVSNKYISEGYKRAFSKENTKNVIFWDRDKLINLLSLHYKEYFRHNDKELAIYEQNFIDYHKEEDLLKELKLPNEKFNRLMDIYINPSLFRYYEDSATGQPLRKRLAISDVIIDSDPIFIDGISGSGKTTLLRKIGNLVLESNQNELDKKTIPVFISSTDLNYPNAEIKDVILERLELLSVKTIDSILAKYNLLLLIDSIDEFEHEKQLELIRQLNNLSRKGCKYILGSRQATTISAMSKEKYKIVTIGNFNLDQIKRFVSAFLSDEVKSDELLRALRENKIIERLPITPLTLSLITLLYEEYKVEIPATLTDIYNKFNDLIMGRAFVSSKLQFLDVNFRESVLSSYALLLMMRENHTPLRENEFIVHFTKEFENVTPPNITKDNIKDALRYIIKNTGILYLKDQTYICFAHNSYMEYYASREIFNHQRDKEDLYVDNFFDINWQNSAIFYGGHSKRMELFAKKIDSRLKTATKLHEYISSIQGTGYLLQALYLTDNSVRASLIESTLENVVNAYDLMSRTATTDIPFLKGINIPIIALLNFIHFYQMFNSITLKEPLIKVYSHLSQKWKLLVEKDTDSSILVNLGFKLLDVAYTLGSNRLSKGEYLEDVIFNHKRLFNDPLLAKLASLALEWANNDVNEKLKKELAQNPSMGREIQKTLVTMPAVKFRLSPLDTLLPNRKVLIFTEGKTDALIIDHAYMVLTGGSRPYWTSRMATINGETGSCKCVGQVIKTSCSYSEDTITIGLLDNDNAGIAIYNQINNNIKELEEGRIKKINGCQSFLLVIPIPGEYEHYIQKKQEFNFFEIEHYFGYEYLQKHDMLKETGIPNIYEIKDNKKTSFANQILKETDPKVFELFKDLFLMLDSITGFESHYIL